jgi:hypothetical protein
LGTQQIDDHELRVSDSASRNQDGDLADTEVDQEEPHRRPEQFAAVWDGSELSVPLGAVYSVQYLRPMHGPLEKPREQLVFAWLAEQERVARTRAIRVVG